MLILVILLISTSTLLSQNINLDVNLIKTGKYNIHDFDDPSVSLWTVNIQCIDCIQNNASVDYIIEIRLDFNNYNPAIWAATYSRTMTPQNPSDILSNYQVQDGAGLLPQDQYVENDGFISLLNEALYLPAGTISLVVNIWKNDELLNINTNSTEVTGTLLATDSELNVQNNVVSELTLLDPPNYADVLDPYPWFRWESPGFLSGVNIHYQLYVYLYNPIFHSNVNDAIADNNFLYFTKEILEYETGTSQQIQVQYPTDDRDLACGYQYVWYVEAQDIIPDSPFNDESGIWGWPTPVQSPLYIFNYGSTIASENIVSPSIGSEVSTVLPSFSVDPIDCAETYEIWLSSQEDSDVENPIWGEGVSLQSNVISYTSDATGLMPGNNYKWKIRVNPDSDPGPWSDIFNFKIASYTLDSPSAGEVINTISPTFNFSGPSDIAGFELRISNTEDPMVDYGNIYNQYVHSFPYELPADIPIGLLPENTYFWKLIFFDGNENIIGEIDNYSTVESFSIAGVTLNSPSNGSSDLSLMPSFSWEGPIGITQYELSLSGSDDPLVENPLFTVNVSGTYYQFPQYGDYSLEYGKLYYWKIVPFDMNENRGVPSSSYSFSTAEDVTETSTDESDYTKPEFSISGGSDNSPKDIIVTLLTAVTGADEYHIYFSQNQDMSSPLAEIILEASQTEAILDGTEIDWGASIYVQVFALSDGENIGEESNVQIIILPEQPGTNDQVGISVIYDGGTTQLTVEITNYVANASEYILELAYDAQMSDIFYSGPAYDNMATVYPETEEPLNHGETYFIQVHAMYNDEMHGLPSSVSSIFIPNIIPPILIDQFSWEATVPVSNSYIIQFSTTDDFLSILFEEAINGTIFTLQEEILNPGTAYYWKVQGIDNDSNAFGEASSIGYLITESIPPPSLNTLSEETSLLPEFNWEPIEQALSYLIDVATDASMENMLWSNIITSTNTIYDEAALLLEFSTTYYWRISTLSDDGSILSISSIESFSTTSLFPVSGLSPNGGTETLTPTLEWELNNNYQSYRIIIAEDSEFSTIILNSIIETNNYTLNENLLLAGSKYFWKIEGLDANSGNIAGPSETALLVMPSATEIPLISPENNYQVSNLMPKLQWGSLENISSYNIIIATDPEITTLAIDEIVSGTEYQIPEDKALINSMTYYWQIEVATENVLVKSEIRIFSTPSEIEITILSLDDGANVSITNPIFSWEPIEGVSAYNIQFSTDSEFSESWLKQSGSSNFEYTSEPLLEFNTLYHWRICALNNAGERISKWTNARSFTLSNAFIVNLEGPPSGEALNTKKPTFSWTPFEEVSKYEIRISSNEDYSQIMWQSDNLAQNSVQYPSSGSESLLAETIYYWSVRALRDNIALGEFCKSFTFTISEKNKPVLTGPINEISENTFPFFTWNKIVKANSYGIVLGNNSELSQIIFENHNISDKQYHYPADAPPLDYNTAYYWKLIAYDENSSPLGDYSEITMFTTPTGIVQIEFIYE